MPALFVNLKIDQEEKFDFFKVTFSEIIELFDEYHIKIRGNYTPECLKFIKQYVSEEACSYQNLDESNWVSASIKMLEQVKSRSIFIYFDPTPSVTNLN